MGRFVKNTDRTPPGLSKGLCVLFYVAADRLEEDGFTQNCWVIGDRRSNGRICPAVGGDGTGRFNSKSEAERGLEALLAAGITSGEQIRKLGAERFCEIVYRDLFW